METEKNKIKDAATEMMKGMNTLFNGIDVIMKNATAKMSDAEKIQFHKAVKDQGINEKANKFKDEINQFKNIYNI